MTFSSDRCRLNRWAFQRWLMPCAYSYHISDLNFRGDLTIPSPSTWYVGTYLHESGSETQVLISVCLGVAECFQASASLIRLCRFQSSFKILDYYDTLVYKKRYQRIIIKKIAFLVNSKFIWKLKWKSLLSLQIKAFGCFI